MKSLHLLAALTLPLAACGTTSKSSVQPAMSEPVAVIEDQAEEEPVVAVDPLSRLEGACLADARALGLFQMFGLTETCIAASSISGLSEVAGALVSQDKAALVAMCEADAPQAFVMPRGTWLEVIATGTEAMQFAGGPLEVELVTCEVVAAPDDRHVGHMVTMPIGWIQGRIAIE